MTDRIQQALEKEYTDVSRFNEKHFPIVTRERRAALAVIEAAHGCVERCDNIGGLVDALNAWASCILGEKP